MTRGIFDDAGAAPPWLQLGDAGTAPAAKVARTLDLAIAALLAGSGIWLLAGAMGPTDPPTPALVAAPDAPAEPTQRDGAEGQVEPPATEPTTDPRSKAEPTTPRPTVATTGPELEGPTEPADAPASGDVPAIAGDPKSRDPKAAEAAAQRGQNALKSGKRSSAKKLFEEALALDPDNAEALMGLSNLSFDAGNYATAEKYARQAVQLAPRNADYNLRLGDAYFKLAQYPRARSSYQKAAKLGHPFAAARLDRLKGK